QGVGGTNRGDCRRRGGRLRRCRPLADLLQEGHHLFEGLELIPAVVAVMAPVAALGAATGPVERVGLEHPRADRAPGASPDVLRLDLARMGRLVRGRPGVDAAVDPTVELPEDRVDV